MTERRRAPKTLGEYDLDGGAFGPAPRPTRSEQRETAEAARRTLSRSGSLWKAILRRTRAG